jgi:hypothetical protein
MPKQNKLKTKLYKQKKEIRDLEKSLDILRYSLLIVTVGCAIYAVFTAWSMFY